MSGVFSFLRRFVWASVFLMAVAFLSGLAGGLAVLRNVEPVASALKTTNRAISYIYLDLFRDAPAGRGWRPANTPLPENSSPIVRHEVGRAQPGLNLVTAATSSSADLVSMDGRVVYSWRLPFSEAWPNPAHVKGYRKDALFYWRRAHLFPNGDLLVVYESPDLSPHGMGLAKIDRDSNLLWKLAARARHDVAVDDDGFIYILNTAISSDRYPDLPMISPPFFKEAVVKISPDGKVVARWPIIDAFLNSSFAPVLLRMGDGRNKGDYTHSNTVEYIDARTAAIFPFVKQGQLLISMRELDVIAVLDPEEGAIVWSMEGPWHRQHEPQFLGNGNMLIFDNAGHIGPGGRSRVVEFEPLTGKTVWSYTGTEEEPLYTSALGSQQRLANGDTLITESHNGRAIEVTPDQRIVWEYRHPQRQVVDDRPYITIIFEVLRVDPADLTFLGDAGRP